MFVANAVRETVEMSRDKYAWGTVTSSLPKTEDKPIGVIFFLKKDFIL